MENSDQAPAIREDVKLVGNLRFIGEIGPLFEALAKAQAEFTEMERDAQVAFERRMFKYATLAEVLSSVRPALNRNGLALLQPFDGDTVTTIIAFGAARIEAVAGLPPWSDVQKLGSALTYIKRYQLKSLLGVNDGEDDDGNEASGTGKAPEPRETKRREPPPAREQKRPPDGVTAETSARIGALGRELKLNRAELEERSRKAGCGLLGELTEINALRLVVALEAERAAQ